MKVTRDNIVSTDPKYDDFSSWAALDIDDGHAVLKAAVERCASDGPVSTRFANIRSTDPYLQRKERKMAHRPLGHLVFQAMEQQKKPGPEKGAISCQEAPR